MLNMRIKMQLAEETWEKEHGRSRGNRGRNLFMQKKVTF